MSTTFYIERGDGSKWVSILIAILVIVLFFAVLVLAAGGAILATEQMLTAEKAATTVVLFDPQGGTVRTSQEAAATITITWKVDGNACSYKGTVSVPGEGLYTLFNKKGERNPDGCDPQNLYGYALEGWGRFRSRFDLTKDLDLLRELELSFDEVRTQLLRFIPPLP